MGSMVHNKLVEKATAPEVSLRGTGAPRKSVSFSDNTVYPFLRCDDCKDMCFDPGALCKSNCCTRFSCSKCSVNELCVACYDDVRGVVCSLWEKTATANKDIDYDLKTVSSASGIACCNDSPPDYWEPRRTLSDEYHQIGYMSDDVCEHALKNTEENGKILEGCKAAEEAVQAKGAAKLTLKVREGTVKARIENRLHRYRKREMRNDPFGYPCKPHYGSSEPLRVGVSLQYCGLKSQRDAPVKLVWNLYRNTTFCSPRGWKIHLPLKS